MKNVIVTAADTGFFSLLEGLILSIVEQWKPITADIYVIDLGLKEDEIKWLHDHQIKTESGIEISQALSLPLNTPQEMATCLRVYLPRIFTGYQKYLWIDADTWVQDPGAIDSYFLLTDEKDVVATVELDRTYACCYSPGFHKEKMYSFYFKSGFGEKNSKRLSLLPVLNCGVFSANVDSMLWKEWPEILWKIINGSNIFNMADQNTFNYLYYINKISCLILPAEYNWLVMYSPPVFEKDKKLLLTPVQPHALVKILHLAGFRLVEDRGEMELLGKSADGEEMQIPLKYRGWEK